MGWDWLQGVVERTIGGTEADPAPISRRDLLKGLGALGVVAAAAPALLAPSEARSEIVEAQYGGGRRRRRSRGRGRGRSRGHRRRRISARELRWRCSNDWRFRRRNPNTCRRVLAWRPPRRGACIHIGALTVCG